MKRVKESTFAGQAIETVEGLLPLADIGNLQLLHQNTPQPALSQISGIITSFRG